MGRFSRYGLQIVGISSNSPESHGKFVKTHDFPFPLLTDPGHQVAKRFGCSSKWMLGRVSRAIFIIGKDKTILYRYVELTILSRRKAEELMTVLNNLKSANRI